MIGNRNWNDNNCKLHGTADMKIQFIGVGTQFSSQEQYHSNMVITARSGKRMLIDCGSDARFSLAENGILPQDIDAVYISHLHADHIGGLEWLALSTYFSPVTKNPELFCEEGLQHELWNHSLKGGLECIGEKSMELSDYFNCHGLNEESSFQWEEITFKMVKTPHVIGTCCNTYSYGLLVGPKKSTNGSSSFFITTDTVFQPELLEQVYKEVDLIFHDCETSENETAVHAHYDQLSTLPEAVKRKIWLYHYQPNTRYNPQKNGFQGFITKGQEFLFPLGKF